MNNNLISKRQFLLIDKEVVLEGLWNKYLLDNKMYLYYQQDLNFVIETKNDKKIILLGYILDPINQNKNNNDIIKDIINNVTKTEDLFKQVYNKGGRFIIISFIGKDKVIINDPLGLRSIFYYYNENSQIVCGSQPSLIGKIMNIDYDIYQYEDLKKLKLFMNNEEYWFPGKLTLFKNIYQLIPNHYLNLINGKDERFWPLKPLNRVSIKECVIKSSNILSGLINSATNRYKIKFGLTAGLDSRVVLSASKENIQNISFFTHTHKKLLKDGYDIIIPKKILKTNNLKHNIILKEEIFPNELTNILKKNVFKARINKALNAYSISKYFDKEDNSKVIIMNGNGSEIARNFYRLPFFIRLSSKSLMILNNMYYNSFIEKNINFWLNDAEKIKKNKIDILSLFYWEIRMGCWAAMTYNEYDMFFDSFSPFNNRYLLEMLLSVNKKYRKQPDYLLQKKIIRNLWGKLLLFPINSNNKFKSNIINIIKKFKFYNFIYNIKFFYKFFKKK